MIKNMMGLLHLSVGPLRLLMLVLGGVLLGIGEMLSIGALVPLIAHFQSGQGLSVLEGYLISFPQLLAAFVLLIFLKSIYGLIFSIYQSRIMFDAITKVSSSVLDRYLSGPMSRVYGDNNPTAVRNIFNESNLLGVGVFLPLSIIFAEFFVAIFLLSLVYLVLPIAILVLSSSVLIYAVFVWLPTRKLTARVGRVRQDAEKDRLQLAMDTLRMFPEIRTSGMVDSFVTRYRVKTNLATDAMAKFWVLRQFPKLSFEFILLCSSLAIYSILHYTQPGVDIDLAAVGVAGIGIFRLIPSAVRIFSSLSSIKYNSHTINVLTELLITAKHKTPEENIDRADMGTFKTVFFDSVNWGHTLGVDKPYSIRNVRFTSGFNLVSGASGSGKSSLLLALCGLNQNSEIQIGSSCEVKSLRDFYSATVHVSQNTMVSGVTMLDALQFEVDDNPEELDLALQLINICYPKLSVDAKTTGLSGGQVKLIAFCRALLKNRPVILLDEIFAGVDASMTNRIIDFCKANYPQKVFVLITHDEKLLMEGNFPTIFVGAKDE